MAGIIYSFESLNAWKESRKLVVEVYKLLNRFPNTEKYALCDQLRRSATSIPSNLAEGSSRSSTKEKIHYIEIAYGSLMETYCQLLIASDLQYISPDDVEKLKPTIDNVAKLLTGLRHSFKP